MSKFIPVGGTFEYEGVTYKAVESDSMNCNGCAFCRVTGPCLAHKDFPCVAGRRSDDKEVTYVKVGHKGPKDLVSIEDLKDLKLTYEQLALLYSLTYRCNGGFAVYQALQKLLDHTKEVWAEMKGLDSAWDTKYHDFKDYFLSLLFPEDTKITRKKELEDHMRKIQEELAKL